MSGIDRSTGRNVRLVKIYGLCRAGYTLRQIGHILGLTVDYVCLEAAVAREHADELVSMLAGCREWDHVFPERASVRAPRSRRVAA